MTYTIHGVDYTITRNGNEARLECLQCHQSRSDSLAYAWAGAHAVHH